VDAGVEDAIRRAAREEGVPEETALAYAERESSFRPYARSSRTIYGLYQMQKRWRDQYGSGESADPYAQTKAWARFYKDNKAEMAGVLGRDPTDAEAYLGHHFGGTRGARIMGMNPNTPVQQVFTPTEIAQNPHIAAAGTTGALHTTLVSDMDKRMTKFGGDSGLDFSPQVGGAPPQTAQPAPAKTAEPLDFSSQVAMQ